MPSVKDYWAAMSPEERQAEMARRVKKRNATQARKKTIRRTTGIRGRPRRKVYTCKYCGETGFRTPQAIAGHVRVEHPRNQRNQPTQEATNDQSGNGEKDYSDHIAYLYGKIETIIEYYANSNTLPQSTLAEGVATLLRH